MAKLPQVPRRLETTQAAKSQVTAAEVAAPYASFGKALDKLGEGLEDVAVRIADEAGQKAVTQNPDGSLTVDRMPLLSGRAGIAYNRAAKTAYIARLEPEISKQVLAKQIEFQGQPQKFDEWGQQYITDMVAGQPDETMRNAVRGMAARHVQQTSQGLTLQRHRIDLENGYKAITDRIGDLDNEMATLARQGGVDTPEYRARQADAGQLYHDLTKNPLYKYPQERAKREMDELVTRHKSEAIIGTATALYDKGTPTAAAEARKFLTESAWDKGLNLSPDQRQKIITRGMAALEGRTAENKAMVDANKKLITETIEGLKTDAPYNPRQIEDLLARTQQIGDVESFYKLTTYRALHDWRRGWREAPLGQQTQMLRELQGGETALAMRESGGNPAAVNRFGYAGTFQWGAPRLSALGLYQPGAGENLDTWSRTPRAASGKWSGTFNIPGHPEVRTLADFLASPDAQKAVRKLDIERMDSDIAANGFDRFVGQTVGGVPITAGGLRNMLHLGGVGGTRAFLESGGRENRADANGTTLADYARMGARGPQAPSAATVMFEAIRTEAANDLRNKLGTQVETAVGALETAIGKNRRPGDQELAGIVEAIQITGRTDLVPRIEKALAGYDQAQVALSQPGNLRDAFRGRMQQAATESGDPAVRKVVDTAEDVIKRTEADMKARPYSTSAARRGLNPPMPLDFSNPDAIDKAVQQRGTMDRISREMDGTPARSIFEAGEGEAFKQAMAAGDSATVAGTLAAVTKLDAQQFQATMADKDFAKGVVTASVSPDPAKMGAAMSFLDRAWRSNPTKFNADFGADSAKRLQAWQWMKDTYGPAEIAERMQRLDDPATAGAREILKKAGKEEASKIGLSDVVAGFKAGWVPFTGPGAPVNVTVRGLDGFAQERLSAEFDEFYKQARETGLPADEAQKAATDRLKIAWGPSVANGGNLMRHPPEKYYQMVDGGHDWIKGQIDEFLIAADPAGVRNRRITPLDPEAAAAIAAAGDPNEPRYQFTALIADSQTEGEISNGIKPSYQIVAIDNRTGKMDVVKAPDGRSRFRFDDSGPKAESEQRLHDFNAGIAAMFPTLSDAGAF